MSNEAVAANTRNNVGVLMRISLVVPVPIPTVLLAPLLCEGTNGAETKHFSLPTSKYPISGSVQIVNCPELGIIRRPRTTEPRTQPRTHEAGTDRWD